MVVGQSVSELSEKYTRLLGQVGEFVAAEHDAILDDPEPSVWVAKLADSAVLLQSRFWIADPDREEFSETRSEYVQTVAERFQVAGIDLSTTTQHDLGGELTIHDAPTDASGAPR
jgi:small conductance mechanosensitive channel